MIVYKKEYDELVTEILIKLESLVEYLMNGIEMPENVSIYVVGGCKYYTNFANTMKEALGEKSMICNPTREVENTSHGCWKVVHDMIEGKLKIEGSEIVWGFENEEEEKAGEMKCIEEDKKLGESEGENNGTTVSAAVERGNGSGMNDGKVSELIGNREVNNREEKLSKPKTNKRKVNQSATPIESVDANETYKNQNIPETLSPGATANKSGSPSQKSCDKERSHSVTIKVCEYPRLPLPHKLKATDFAKSIRDFMKKMLLQEKEILIINSISTLWNDISKRIYEKIEKLKNQDKADELLIVLNKLDKKKYTVLMDSVEEMNKGWKKLADELKVNIENEMAQISIIQNEWKKEKSRIESTVDSRANSSKSTLKGEYYEIEYKEDNESKRIKTSDHCAKKLI